jgi:N-methylhydantoinase B
MTLDPASRTIIGGALRSLPVEMGENLIRSAYSSVIREARDASTALLDSQGRVVAQAQLIPIHMNSFGLAFQAMTEAHDITSFGPGEGVITNDPYSGGQHLNDIILFTPIFAENGELAGFSGSIGHHIDIGGGAAGPNSLATDLQAEGLCLPLLRIDVQRDLAADGVVGKVIRANVRAPELVMGDVAAQVAANETGAAGLRALHRKYGMDAVTEVMASVMDYSERLMRAAISAVPDGTYEGQDVVDDDGFTDEPLRVHAAVTIHGDSMTVDLTQSSRETRGSVNVPLACTYSSVYGAVAAVLGGRGVPVNDGCYRPIETKVAERSLLNPSRGRPVRARMLAVSRVFDAIMLALAQAAPERVIASGHNSMTGLGLSHRGPDRHRVYLEILGGGWGAGPANDGADVLDVPLANCSNIPIEAIENDHPYMRVTAHELITDSGGAGRTRGGMGLRRIYEILEDDVELAAYTDRVKHAPWGLEAGGSGSPTRLEVRRGGERTALRSKVNTTLMRGDTLVVETAGGGGYGDPRKRPAGQVAADLIAGRITSDAACSAYGVDPHAAPGALHPNSPAGGPDGARATSRQ